MMRVADAGGLSKAGLTICWAVLAGLAWAGGSGTPADPPATPVSAPAGAQDAIGAPLELRIGNVSIAPVGFLDMTAVWRSVNAGTGIGSNFGNIPFQNSTAAHLNEFRFSIQNSRLGFRISGSRSGWDFTAYNEIDFLGSGAANNIGVTNGAFVPRIRLFWLDTRKGRFEFLGGQSWSLLTPGRKGISPLPENIFLGQVIDVNYIAGLPWTRQAGVRVVYHPSRKAALGLSLENPDQYMGGSGGGGQIVLPAALGSAGAQLDNGGAAYLSTPNPAPDFIEKIALDPTPRVHVEASALERIFRVVDPSDLRASQKMGVGILVAGNFGVTRKVRLVTNNYWSDGGGRYLYGQAPDVVVRANGDLSPLHAVGVVEGLEAAPLRKLQVYAYYGAIYVGRSVAVDANGASVVGYGYAGSANSQNRTIQEITGGVSQTLWKDPRYGALTLMGQYEYLTRAPWYVAPTSARSAHDHTVYFNLRYTLPGFLPGLEN